MKPAFVIAIACGVFYALGLKPAFLFQCTWLMGGKHQTQQHKLVSALYNVSTDVHMVCGGVRVGKHSGYTLVNPH